MKSDKILSAFAPPRRRVADILRSRPRGFWTVDEIAEREGIHRTVAFEHLEALVDAGLATKVSVRGGRGRPANAYRYSGNTVELSYPPRQTRLLAQVLARAANTGKPPRVVAREAGGAIQLESLGGDYKRDGTLMHAATCIFGAVCEGAQDVVCAVHAGLIEGSTGLAVLPEGPDGHGGCSFSVG